MLSIFSRPCWPSVYLLWKKCLFRSSQFSLSVVSDSLQRLGLQHSRPSCLSPPPRVYSDSSSESLMPPNHLILCHPLLLSPLTFPSIRVFSNESALRIRLPKYWSFSFSISPSSEYSGLISLQSKGLSRVFFNTIVQKHQFLSTQLSL